MKLAKFACCVGALTLLATGCSFITGHDEDIPTYPEGTSSVTLQVGETARVHLGTINQSVGEQLGIDPDAEPDPAIVDATMSFEVLGDEEPSPPGTPSDAFLKLEGKGPGHETISIIYCFRDGLRRGCNQSIDNDDSVSVDPIVIDVTVEG